MAESHGCELLAFWRCLDLGKSPYVHPEDEEFFARYRPRDLAHPRLDAASYERDIDAKDPLFTHLSLFPVPYIGDVRRADIFVLMLNPGFSKSEYQVEADGEVIAALQRTLRQELTGYPYPFWYLDPRFRSHPGHDYWSSRLKGSGDLGELSRRIAVVQRFPYHSVRFGRTNVTAKLRSLEKAKDHVHRMILPRVARQQALLIVARAATAFGLSARDQASNLVVYSPGEARGAWLTERTRGGKAIKDWLDSHPIA